MENLQTSKMEKFKNVLIVVLVFTTILLLYFLWGNETIESFIFNENQESHEVLGSEKVIVPNQIVICRGNEDYIVSFSRKQDLWNNQIIESFKSFSEGANILVEEITKEQYETVMKYPSILAKFEYNLPFMGFCEKYGIKLAQGYDSIGYMTEIGFSQGSEESAFVFDNNKRKYYRLVGNKKSELFGQIDTMLAEQGFTPYYTLKTFLGEDSKNNTLIPLELPASLVPVTYKYDEGMNEKDVIEATAQTYFGETFDFVRKVEEADGTTIYMYGYGQKVLIVDPNKGSIEYKFDVKAGSSEPPSMFEALDIALTFVGFHGGFETLTGQQIKPYIESVSYIGDKKNGYRFNFSFMVGKNKLFYEQQRPIVVEVVDGQVSYFRREFISFDETQTDKVSSREEESSAINMLAGNYEYLRDISIRAGIIPIEGAESLSFESIAENIDNLYVGYLKPEPQLVEGKIVNEPEGELIPVWVIEMAGFLLYFDLYDGEPKGFSEIE